MRGNDATRFIIEVGVALHRAGALDIDAMLPRESGPISIVPRLDATGISC